MNTAVSKKVGFVSLSSSTLQKVEAYHYYNKGVYKPGDLCITRGFIARGYNQGDYNQEVYSLEVYNQGV